NHQHYRRSDREAHAGERNPPRHRPETGQRSEPPVGPLARFGGGDRRGARRRTNGGTVRVRRCVRGGGRRRLRGSGGRRLGGSGGCGGRQGRGGGGWNDRGGGGRHGGARRAARRALRRVGLGAKGGHEDAPREHHGHHGHAERPEQPRRGLRRRGQVGGGQRRDGLPGGALGRHERERELP